MTDDEILAAARRTYRSGVKPITNFYYDPFRTSGCFVAAAVWDAIEFAADCTTGRTFARVTGKTLCFQVGCFEGFDGKKERRRDAQYRSGYALGQPARREFLEGQPAS